MCHLIAFFRPLRRIGEWVLFSAFSQTRKKASAMLSDGPGPAGECTFGACIQPVRRGRCTPHFAPVPSPGRGLQRPCHGEGPPAGPGCLPPASGCGSPLPSVSRVQPAGVTPAGPQHRCKDWEAVIPLPVLTVASFSGSVWCHGFSAKCFFWCVGGCAVWSIPGKEGATTSAPVQLEPAGSELRPPPLCVTV